MRLVYSMIIVAVLFSFNAASLEDYTLLDSLSLDFTMSTSVDIEKTSNNAYLEDATIIVNYELINNSNQIIKEVYTIPKTKDDSLTFYYKTLSVTPLSIEINALIETRNDFLKVRNKINFPLNEYDESLYKYLQPSKMIDTNEDIIKLSSELSDGKTDLYEVVFTYAVWINKNIEYDLSSIAAEAVEPSSWVLKNRRGVCDELTNLFISLCRAQGIPARFVSGISYTNSEQFKTPWGPHGWAEVYFPEYGWVPIDPTYGEIGFVDAGHVKLKDDIDSEKSGIEYAWRGKDVELVPTPLEYSVEVIKTGNLISDDLGIQISPYLLNTGFGSYNYFEVIVKNNNDYYVTNNIYVAMPKEVTLEEDNSRPIFLLPNSEEKYYFIFKIPEDLKKEYKYTFPISIVTRNNMSENSEVYVEYKKRFVDYETIKSIVESKEKETPDLTAVFYCKTDTNEIHIEEYSNITCVFENKKNYPLINVNICVEEGCKVSNIGASSSKEFVFTKKFDSQGSSLVKASAKNDDISKNFYFTLMVLDDPKIEIQELVHPSSVGYKDEFDVEFKIVKTSYAIPKDVRVKLIYNKNEESWDVKYFDSVIPYFITLEGRYLKKGTNGLVIEVEYYDDSGKKYVSSEDFVISLENLTIDEKIMIYFNQFSLWMNRIILG